MCGIIVIKIDKDEDQLDLILKSFDFLTSRGPDYTSLISNKNEIIGFKRLSIMDVSNKGNQPFVSGENKLVCNGEIYNYKSLINKHDISCQSGSDCESILHLYNKFGLEKTVGLLSGDFAFVIVTPTGVEFGRDRIGVRPLFYGFTNSGNIAFASLAKSLTKFCQEVKPVLPGWGSYNSRTKELVFNKYELVISEDITLNLFKTIERELVLSVKSRLMSDRPVACMLSGGLDSSLITSILCKLIGPDKVNTYSIGMEGSQDLKYAKKVAEFLGTNHTEVLFTPEAGFEAIPYIINDLESYDITTIRASVGMWLLSKYISENTKDIVILSGEGADELFCGYLYFHYAPSPEELNIESKRLVEDLHIYDVLRADRCVSSHGLELRVPFLDRKIVSMCLGMSGELKKPRNGVEKFILRKSFTNNYLPEEVLWRRKDGFSDGVSGNTGKKWYQQIQEFVDELITDEEFKQYSQTFPNKEALYYKKVYDEIFPTYQPVYDYWLPKWVDHKGDPSGRELNVFNENLII